MSPEEAKELNDKMWMPGKTIDDLANEAFEQERAGNINFWSIPKEDP